MCKIYKEDNNNKYNSRGQHNFSRSEHLEISFKTVFRLCSLSQICSSSFSLKFVPCYQCKVSMCVRWFIVHLRAGFQVDIKEYNMNSLYYCIRSSSKSVIFYFKILEIYSENITLRIISSLSSTWHFLAFTTLRWKGLEEYQGAHG